jgi:hypothetical protein
MGWVGNVMNVVLTEKPGGRRRASLPVQVSDRRVRSSRAGLSFFFPLGETMTL